MHRGSSVEKHQHIRPECKKDLFSRTIEELKHIVLTVFLVKIEAPLGRIRLAVPFYPERGNESEQDDGCAQHEYRLEQRLPVSKHQKKSYHYKVSRQSPDLVHRILAAECDSAFALPRVL